MSSSSSSRPLPMTKAALRKGSKSNASDASNVSKGGTAHGKVGLFIDFSGSTNAQEFYWARVREIVLAAKCKYGEDNILPYFWDYKCTDLQSWANMMSQISSRRGYGGTYPSCISSTLNSVVHNSAFGKVVDKIILITDGWIAQDAVQAFDQVLDTHAAKYGAFASIEGHLVGHEGNMNMSVVVPLMRRTKFVIYKNRDVHMQGDSSRTICWDKDYCGSIDALDRFLQDKDELVAVVYAQNIGRHSTDVIDALTKVRKDLHLQIRRKKERARESADGGNDDPFAAVKTRLRQGQSIYVANLNDEFDAVAEICQKSLETDDETDVVDAYINKMLAHCSGKANYGFSETHVASTTTSNRLRRAVGGGDNSSHGAATALDMEVMHQRLTDALTGEGEAAGASTSTSTSTAKDVVNARLKAYYTAIDCDVDPANVAVVVSVLDGPSLFLDIMTKAEQEFYLTNPWALPANTKLRDAVCKRVVLASYDGAGVKMFESMRDTTRAVIAIPQPSINLESAWLNEPVREGGIAHPFSRASMQEHMKDVVSALFFKECIMTGNAAVWFAVLYLCLQFGEGMGEVSNTRSWSLRSLQLMASKTLKKARTNITLSGAVVEPNIETDVNFALWYCVHTPWIAPSTNRLRQMRHGWPYMKHMLEFASYPVHPDIDVLVAKYDAYAAMLGMAKAAQTAGSPKNAWMIPVRALWQNSVTIDLYGNPVVLLLDGEVSRERRAAVLDTLDSRIRACYYAIEGGCGNAWSRACACAVLEELCNLVDPSTKEEGVDIPLNIIPAEVTDPRPRIVINYGYPISPVHQKVSQPTIHPQTLRPCTIDPTQRRPWEECAVDYGGGLEVPLDQQLSAYNYFIECVTTQNKYPSKAEFLFYMACREGKREARPKDTLPRDVVAYVDELFDAYGKVLGENFEGVSVADFIATTKESMDRTRRQQIENGEIELDGSLALDAAVA